MFPGLYFTHCSNSNDDSCDRTEITQSFLQKQQLREKGQPIWTLNTNTTPADGGITAVFAEPASLFPGNHSGGNFVGDAAAAGGFVYDHERIEKAKVDRPRKISVMKEAHDQTEHNQQAVKRKLAALQQQLKDINEAKIAEKVFQQSPSKSKSPEQYNYL